MTDHKELLERLRYLEKNDPYVMTMSFGPDITEAADAIEALKAENERLLEALMDATAHLVGAVSAYDKFRNKGATGDPFYKTRIADFNKALDRSRRALERKPE